MYFNSLHFALFFALIFGLTAWLRDRVPARNAVLLLASYYFYGCWDWRFLSLIVISTIIDYVAGRALDGSALDPENPPAPTRRRKLILLASLATNLGLLGFFKYFNFFVGSAQEALLGLGLPINVTTLSIVLPVGISFYTFQTLSYTIDVYRGRIPSERNLLNFALYVAFFPQLVAGPIERASRLLPQMGLPTRYTGILLRSGLFLVGWGLFKKVVIADNIAKVADAVFAAGANPTGLEVVIGVYAFAVQIYCDFSGYSDIARGTARLLGFDLMLNFNLPYFATNPSDFWRRWHISLSTWLRDYLYIPLGGNRGSESRTKFNLMATMVLGGLWHGAAWTFVWWGVYHGLLLGIHRQIQPWLERHLTFQRPWAAGLWYWARMLFFFQLVCLSWLLFRAESMAQVGQLLGAIGTNFVGENSALAYEHLRVFAGCWLVFWTAQLIQWIEQDLEIVLRWPIGLRAAAYASLILGILWFGEYGGEAFIYFQF